MYFEATSDGMLTGGMLSDGMWSSSDGKLKTKKQQKTLSDDQMV
jgi:hypothetical protein